MPREGEWYLGELSPSGALLARRLRSLRHTPYPEALGEHDKQTIFKYGRCFFVGTEKLIKKWPGGVYCLAVVSRKLHFPRGTVLCNLCAYCIYVHPGFAILRPDNTNILYTSSSYMHLYKDC